MATITYNTEIAELAASFGTVPARKACTAPKFVAKTINASYAELESFSNDVQGLWAKYAADYTGFVLAA